MFVQTRNPAAYTRLLLRYGLVESALDVAADAVQGVRGVGTLTPYALDEIVAAAQQALGAGDPRIADLRKRMESESRRVNATRTVRS